MKPDLRTLRSRLLIYVSLPLTALLILSLTFDYKIAYGPANEAYDHALMDDAIDLAGRVQTEGSQLRVMMSRATETALSSNLDDEEFLAIYGPDNALLAGDPELRPDDGGPSELPVVSDDEIHGKRVRKATYRFSTPLGNCTSVIAETIHKRERAGSKILIGMILPNVLLILTTLALVYFGVRNGLRPLDQLSAEIGRRAPNDLTPLPEADVPAEAESLISSMNRLLNDLRAASQAHEAFLASAAHQLKTPLAGLQTQLELMIEELPEAQRSRVINLHEALSRLGRLTHQFLALARSTPEALHAYIKQSIDLSTLVQEQASFWFDQANTHRVEVEFHLEPATVTGIEWLLRELMANLIDNAIIHSPPGEHVAIRTGVDNGGHSYFEVEDHGPGVAAEDRERIFERFYRASQHSDGSGLGLAIVKEVAERHDARIILEPASADCGTRIRVRFALAAPLSDCQEFDRN